MAAMRTVRLIIPSTRVSMGCLKVPNLQASKVLCHENRSEGGRTFGAAGFAAGRLDPVAAFEWQARGGRPLYRSANFDTSRYNSAQIAKRIAWKGLQGFLPSAQ